MYKLYCNSTDISNIAGEITWSDSTETLGAELSFSRSLASDNKYISDFNIECGDIITFKNEKTIFQGLVVTKEIEGVCLETYTCFDFLFYLNKNKIIKQINGENADTVIKMLCGQFNIPIGNVPSLPTKITGVYYESSVAEIIEEVLEKVKGETGVQYYLELEDGKLNIFAKGILEIYATYKPADNVAEFDITKAINKEFSKTFSIEEMKNSILVVSVNDENAYLLSEKNDSGSISKYGLLQEVYQIDENDKNNANNIAGNLLNELNKVEETVTVTLIGNDDVRAGRVLNFSCDKSKINGRFFIKECTHSLTKQKIHTMELELEKI